MSKYIKVKQSESNKEDDADLYHVMLRLLKEKGKEYGAHRGRLSISIVDEDNPTISILWAEKDSMEMIPLETIRINEA